MAHHLLRPNFVTIETMLMIFNHSRKLLVCAEHAINRLPTDASCCCFCKLLPKYAEGKKAIPNSMSLILIFNEFEARINLLYSLKYSVQIFLGFSLLLCVGSQRISLQFEILAFIVRVLCILAQFHIAAVEILAGKRIHVESDMIKTLKVHAAKGQCYQF